MNHEERHRESLLLKERWNLMCSGIDKKHIIICGSKLFVKDQLHGEITASGFVPKHKAEVLSPSNDNSAMELVDRPASDSN